MANGDARNHGTCMLSYEKALLAAQSLEPHHPVVLSLAVSHSVFLYEGMGKQQTACRRAYEAYHAARERLESEAEHVVKASMDPLKVSKHALCVKNMSPTPVCCSACATTSSCGRELLPRRRPTRKPRPDKLTIESTLPPRAVQVAMPATQGQHSHRTRHVM